MPNIATPDAVRRPIADLLPLEYNPRTAEAPGLADSLEGFGLLAPLVVNTFPGRVGRIVGGEKRWRQLIAAGIADAPVIEVNLPPEAERELCLRLNRAQADWDWGLLEEHFAKDDLLSWGFQAWEFGEIPPAADSMSNPSTSPAHDTRNYLGGATKKFELLIAADQYEAVAAAFARLRVERGLETNTAVMLSLLEPFMVAQPPAAEAAGEEASSPAGEPVIPDGPRPASRGRSGGRSRASEEPVGDAGTSAAGD